MDRRVVPPTCIECKTPIDRPDKHPADAVLLHFTREHAATLSLVDRRQFTNQAPKTLTR